MMPGRVGAIVGARRARGYGRPTPRSYAYDPSPKVESKMFDVFVFGI